MALRCTLACAAICAGVATTSPPAAAAPCTPLVFPGAEGAHGASSRERWQLYAHLATSSGQEYDVAFTIASFAAPGGPADTRLADARTVGWATARLMPASVSFVDRAHHHMTYARRLERTAAGLARAASDRLETSVGDWTLREEAPSAQVANRRFHLHVVIGETTLELDQLALKAALPYDMAPECAYAYTRLRARGTLRLGGATRAVSGTSWLDHSWSGARAAASDASYDRFAIAFDDGRELLLRALSNGHGGYERVSGMLVAADGSVRRLGSRDASIANPLQTEFTSPVSALRYSSLWEIRVPVAGLDLAAVPPVQDLEVPNADLSAGTYAGPIDIESAALPEGHRGHGFVELTRRR